MMRVNKLNLVVSHIANDRPVHNLCESVRVGQPAENLS